MQRIDIDVNKVVVAGHVVDFGYKYTCHKERFYGGTIVVERKSDAVDKIPFVVSERLIDADIEYEGKFAEIVGEYRSISKNGKLKLNIFAKEVFTYDQGSWTLNDIELTGYICKPPEYRKTHLDKDICDLLIAVNGKCGKVSYIPCIYWGRDAKYVSELTVGTKISVSGRIQSRKYRKKVSETSYEVRTAYEVSIKEIGRVDINDKD